MIDSNREISDEYTQTINPVGLSSVLLVCEHASSFIPAEFNSLGLQDELCKSHVAWDPGALAVAQRLADNLDASLVASGVSRLVYDCNRPPTAPDAMPARSEIIDIPGNLGLSFAERNHRVQAYYEPFQRALKSKIAKTANPVIVTIHSFTPVYHGQQRAVEIGVLHDTDTRLADAMLALAADHTQANVRRNQPYGPEHGVTHTLIEHAIPDDHFNVMLEIRNDLIRTDAEQIRMADMLAGWIVAAFASLNAQGSVECVV
ncbi:N-formylglutamate amidohydrolase [Shimia litoralis]|uniref:N-formylglutamate amidohydrolase n=1 Tax=Shimia litoralis TaxID=420403 RepID=A0A4U7N4Y6_9RHOB|nr:N-formylglutamate amidohydrolase [Shimia litoralis]TKZ20845.1 N-formylglutamate amidohydrolase [Shimia litoralis]